MKRRRWGRIAWRRLGAFRDPRLVQSTRWMLLSCLVGAVSGIGALLFDLTFSTCSHFLLEGIGGYAPPSPGGEAAAAAFGPLAAWRLPVATVVGALLSGALVARFAPEAEGHGTDAVIKAFHVGLGRIRARVPIVKMLASSLTIGSGGSAGREGPIAQIGAGFGSFLGDLLHLSNRERRILMMAGVAGGIGSIFRAPLGAALVACEVLYREPDFEYEALLPCLMSSITGYAVYASVAGWKPMFVTPALEFRHPTELLAYAILGLACAFGGVLFVRVLYGLRDAFRRVPGPVFLRPAIGAVLLGVIAMRFPQVLGMGYGTVQQAIDGLLDPWFLFAFAGLKILATSFTISSGGSGGVFAPSLVMGGALGGAFGLLAERVAPGMIHSPAAFVMVGMGAFFAGAAKAPLAAVVMVVEMTGSYGLLVPTLLASAVAYLAAPLRRSLYEHQVSSRVDSAAHLGSFAVDLLESLSVADALGTTPRCNLLPADLLATEVSAALGHAAAPAHPVVDAEDRLVGVLTLDALGRAMAADELGDGVTALDLAVTGLEPATRGDSLRVTLQAFLRHQTDALPVVDSLAGRRVIGLISRGDVLVAYDRELRRRRELEEQ